MVIKYNINSLRINKTLLNRLFTSVLSAALSLLAACQTNPAAKMDDAAAINKVSTAEQASLAQVNHWQNQVKPTIFANTGWLNDLNDTELNAYVKIAFTNNPNLKASAATLQAAISAAKATNANVWPTLTARISPSRRQLNSGSTTQKIYSTSVGQSLEASWEADIWGRLSAERKAAAFDTDIQRANYKAAELSLVANVARAWYNLNANKLSLDISRKQLKSQQTTLDIVESAYKSGLNSALDVYLNRTDIANRESQIFNEEEVYEQAVRTFKKLLGSYPTDDIKISANLPILSTTVPAGLPAEMIGRRPDVIASLRAYQSTEQNTLIARKAKLPAFSLTASYGGSSESLRLIDSKNLLWNLAGNLVAPIFRGGELTAREDQARFLQDAQLQSYIATLLDSFAEVENALSAEQQLRKRIRAFEDAGRYSESAYELALEQYRAGLTNYNSLLEAQRRWFNAQSNLISLRNALLQNRISLHLALGGDFSH